ncbi:MAG TPA: phenylpropionate dioxygenase [Hellea balneolensis]|uniref:Phenylpropionate dioxygenase n=1 Tax=Hellea balneolensis TaxID=287478 RepID=A0A7C3FYF4_9PROT|nr:phenylpropionate dioxygenase [Hellea balneolensis]
MSATKQDIIDFIYAEVALIDEQKFTQWLDLFTEDGLYWMPLEFGQTEEHLTTSLMYEDKLLLTVRVERLHGARTFSQKPRSRCHHLLQRPEILNIEGDTITTRTAFHYTETRLDEQFFLVGWAEHTLRDTQGGLRIERKRVNLINPEAAHRNIQLFV